MVVRALTLDTEAARTLAMVASPLTRDTGAARALTLDTEAVRTPAMAASPLTLDTVAETANVSPLLHPPCQAPHIRSASLCAGVWVSCVTEDTRLGLPVNF